MPSFKDVFDRAVKGAEERQWISGRLGRLNSNGSISLKVKGRSNFVHVRVGPEGELGSTIARNLGVPLRAHLPVRMKREGGVLVIHSVDHAGGRLDAFLGGTDAFPVPFHTHRLGSGLEYEVQSLLLEPGAVRHISGFNFRVNPFRFRYRGEWDTYPGGLIDVSGTLPLTNWAWVVIYLDPELNILNSMVGEEKATSDELTPWLIDDMDLDETIPLLAIKVHPSDTSLSNVGRYLDVRGWTVSPSITHLNELLDVDFPYTEEFPNDGDVLTYHTSTSSWGPSNPGSTTLSGLSDVDVTDIEDGDVLVWDSSTGTWIPGEGGGSSEPGVYEVGIWSTSVPPPSSYSSSSSAYSFKGNFLTPLQDIEMHGIGAFMDVTASATYQLLVVALDSLGKITSVLASVSLSSTVTATKQMMWGMLDEPITLTTGQRYGIVGGRTDSLDNTPVPIYTHSTIDLPFEVSEQGYLRIADKTPVVDDTFDFSVGGDLFMLGYLWRYAEGPTFSIGTAHTHALDELSDVVLTTPASGDVLTFDGTEWVNSPASGGSPSLSGLTDVNLTSPSSGEILTFNGTEWINDALTTPPIPSLAELADVNAPLPETGQVIVYNDVTGEWAAVFLDALLSSTGEQGVFVEPGGDVGVGTLSPEFRLHVYKAAGTAALLVQSGDSNAAVLLDSAVNSDSYLRWREGGADTFVAGVDGDDGDKFKIQSAVASPSLATTPAIAIDQNNNVAIGHTNPVSQFHVQGPTAGVRLQRDSGHAFIQLGKSNVTNIGGRIGAVPDALGLIFQNFGGSSEWGRFDANGNLGLGTALPQGRLHAHNGQVGMLLWSDPAVSSAKTIIPNGTGDVTTMAIFFFIIDTGSAVVADYLTVANNSNSAVAVGGNTYTFAVAADGSMGVARSVGSGSAKVSIFVIWV